jgi:hypothetical protein
MSFLERSNLSRLQINFAMAVTAVSKCTAQTEAKADNLLSLR